MLYEPQSEKEWKQLIGTNFKNSGIINPITIDTLSQV